MFEKTLKIAEKRREEREGRKYMIYSTKFRDPENSKERYDSLLK